ncbi:MAG: gliding motility-associated C-terminal domain-containing protein [Lewinellaceae bacterium]|nr:gliding motility-associated C-terminal domain-containing protein [Lewinellaceae bacterium]
MNSQLFLSGLFFLLNLAAAFGQEPSITTCDGVQRICLDSRTYELCVRITVEPEFTEPIEKFVIDWGDGTEILEVPGSTSPGDQSHVYDLTDFFETCTFEMDYLIELSTYVVDDPEPKVNLSKVWFRNPPQARFSIANDTICINETAVFILDPCPPEQLEYAWNYGDSSDMGMENSHPYNETGIYDVTLKVENLCGEDESTQTLEVIGFPEAAGEAVTGVINDSMNSYTVCLGGGGQVELDADSSENAMTYDWAFVQGGGYTWITPQDTVKPMVVFNAPGLYELVLTVDNSCEAPDTESFFFNVIDAPIVEIDAQPDECEPFQYTPSPLIIEATYIVNGTTYFASEFPISLDFGSHTVIATLENECANQTAMDEFEVAEPEPVEIQEPVDGLVVCAGSEPIELVANFADGAWEGDHIIQPDTQAFFFNPEMSGEFTITCTEGTGTCERSDRITITVREDFVLELFNPGDTCMGYDYIPEPYLEEASYTINGIPYTDFPQPLALGEVYTVVASLSNECGNQADTITFDISPSSDVTIVSPVDTVRVCAGSEPVIIEGNIMDGEWDGDLLTTTGNTATFNPTDSGEFLIIYWKGYGPCRRADTLIIEVEGIRAEANDIQVCPWSDPITLTGTPAGGTWSSADCPGCIDGNSFVPANLNGLQYVTISYTVTNDIGCESTDGAVVTVLEPQAAFSITSACLNMPVEIDVSIAIGQTFLWRVDDVMASPPPFSGLSEGPHVIEMIAVAGYCRDTVSEEVFIVAPPSNAGFETDNNRICPSTGVNFHPIGESEDGLAYTWDFGRNDPDTVRNFTPPNPVIFDNNTDSLVIYEVSFTIANECGEAAADTIITVVNNPWPQIGIDSSRVGCSPYTVLITNRSIGNPDSCSWMFSDSFSLSNCLDAFTHTFSAPEATTVFSIALTVANECGDSTVLDSITVIPPGVQAFYNLDDSDFIVCAFDTLQFEDASTPAPLVWNWNFGDNNFDTLANPIHVFEIPDSIFNVSLRVSTGCGFDEVTRQVRTLPAPEVDFELPPFGCADQEVEGIINFSPGDLHSYYWNFGNNTAGSTSYHPSPVFDAGGQSYPITLTVEDFPNRCRNSLTKDLLIREPTIADFTVLDGDTIGCQALTGQLQSSAAFANQLSWKVNGRVISRGQEAGFSFGEPGKYPITLIASFDNICFDSLTKFVEVKECNIYIPNAFSPNGDGVNDFFTLYGGPTLEEILFLRIFDRWGNMVFERKNFSDNVDAMGWDGNFNGKPSNSSVYAYRAEVRFIGGITKSFRGDIALLNGKQK